VVVVVAITATHGWFYAWWLYTMYLGFKKFKAGFRLKAQSIKEGIEEEEKQSDPG